jgi:hypothetical protein
VARVSAANLCPNPDHVGARIKLDGTYGMPGHRRQRYKCSPRQRTPYVFTELLPREESWHRSCEHCERQVERREGPKAPRHYQFVARGIAEALAAVGAGDSYMRASRVARARPAASASTPRPARCASRPRPAQSPTGVELLLFVEAMTSLASGVAVVTARRPSGNPCVRGTSIRPRAHEALVDGLARAGRARFRALWSPPVP